MQPRAHAKFASIALALLSIAAASCSKSSTSDHADPVAPSGPAPAQGVTSATLAPSAVAVVTEPSAAASVPNAPTSAIAPPTHGGSSSTTAAPGTAPHGATPTGGTAVPAPSVAAPAVTAVPEPVQYTTTSAAGNHYNVAVSARTECAVGADCNGTITLTASGGYHINDEYPYRFAVDDPSGASWLAADGKGFGKSSGDFKKTAPTVAELAVRYRGTQAGVARLSGTYKMSVCSDANCQVESVPLAFNVTFR